MIVTVYHLGCSFLWPEYTAQEKIIAFKRYLEGTEGHNTIAKFIEAA
ncbi:hypothetical protein MGI18_14625 [Bacillus sp. OVS6]|nr:hypothetical protein MGI18_14625 [Bacillus sp. OVS6]